MTRTCLDLFKTQPPKTAGRNVYAAGMLMTHQEARPLKVKERSGGDAPNPALLGEPRSMKQSELDDYQYSGERLYRDEDVLRELYWGKGLSQNEVAEVLDCSQRSVSRYMEQHDIEVRDRSVDLDQERLERLYIDEGLNQYEIAERVGCSQHHVSALMRKHEMDTRRRKLEKPAGLHTTNEGYVLSTSKLRGEKDYFPIHRLLAVAEHGFDALRGKVVHHKNHVPWANWPSNLKILTPSEHSTHHERDLVWNEEEEAFVPEGDSDE